MSNKVPEQEESDYEVIRKHMAVQICICYSAALRFFSDSNLENLKITDPVTFSERLKQAREWRAQVNASYH